jgi:hypothetical protein
MMQFMTFFSKKSLSSPHFYCCFLLNVSSLMYIFTLKTTQTERRTETETLCTWEFTFCFTSSEDVLGGALDGGETLLLLQWTFQ